MNKFRIIFTLVILSVITTLSTSCSHTYLDDVVITKSSELSIDGKNYTTNSGISVGEKKVKGKVYNFYTVNVDLYFEILALKDGYEIGETLNFEDEDKRVASVIAYGSPHPGLSSKSGSVLFVSENEVHLIDCVFVEEETGREVSVEGRIKF
ncbi:MAG: hypothetical protein KAH10_08410 [Flavobacteriales bacterium]|nr:hypothetical protein [Flavobacteriales bacterium]